SELSVQLEFVKTQLQVFAETSERRLAQLETSSQIIQKQKDEAISVLTEKLIKAEMELASSEERLKNLEFSASELKSDISALREIASAQSEDIRSKDALIENQANEVSCLNERILQTQESLNKATAILQGSQRDWSSMRTRL